MAQVIIMIELKIPTLNLQLYDHQIIAESTARHLHHWAQIAHDIEVPIKLSSTDLDTDTDTETILYPNLLEFKVKLNTEYLGVFATKYPNGFRNAELLQPLIMAYTKQHDEWIIF
jgi:hypothetical protein